MTKNKSSIYQAQCFGNVEPIEYMVPYPNLKSLVVGQCIKFGNNVLYKDIGLTNIAFLKSVNKIANWLRSKGIKEYDRVLIRNVATPNTEILMYGIWSLGGIVLLTDGSFNYNVKNIVTPVKTIMGLSSNDLSAIEDESDIFNSTVSTLLSDEALVYFTNGKGIRLSHYNLLVNAYGIQRGLNILSKNVLNIDLEQNSTAWVVLKAILPFYAGSSLSDNSADITIGMGQDCNFQVKFDWTELKNTKPQCLYILPEATAVLTIGSEPLHLTSIKRKENNLHINGHSVMMGYLNDQDNQRVFRDGSLVISL